MTNTPWGKLFYEVLFQQLGPHSGLKILDFGSGFGITVNYYSERNDVTDLEANQAILVLAVGGENYIQFVGLIER